MVTTPVLGSWVFVFAQFYNTYQTKIIALGFVVLTGQSTNKISELRLFFFFLKVQVVKGH